MEGRFSPTIRLTLVKVVLKPQSKRLVVHQRASRQGECLQVHGGAGEGTVRRAAAGLSVVCESDGDCKK